MIYYGNNGRQGNLPGNFGLMGVLKWLGREQIQPIMMKEDIRSFKLKKTMEGKNYSILTVLT